MAVESQSLQKSIAGIEEKLPPLQEKLNRLTRCYLDQVIDEETYQQSKDAMVVEKTTLKREVERLRKTRSNYWIEPARELVNTLETLGETDFSESLSEMSKLVQKIGTNRLISRKTVTFSLSEPYDFVPSLLASVRVGSSTTLLSRSEEKSQSSNWCARRDSNPRHSA